MNAIMISIGHASWGDRYATVHGGLGSAVGCRSNSSPHGLRHDASDDGLHQFAHAAAGGARLRDAALLLGDAYLGSEELYEFADLLRGC